MAVVFLCECGRKVSAKDEHAGKKATCPHCKEKVQIPSIDRDVAQSKRVSERFESRPTHSPSEAVKIVIEEALAHAATLDSDRAKPLIEETRLSWQSSPFDVERDKLETYLLQTIGRLANLTDYKRFAIVVYPAVDRVQINADGGADILAICIWKVDKDYVVMVSNEDAVNTESELKGFDSDDSIEFI